MNQEFDIIRFFLVYIVQCLIGVVFLFLSFRLLNRDKSRMTIHISIYFLLESIAIFINAIQIPLRIYEFSYFLYYFTLYLYSISPTFLIFYELDLINLKNNWSIPKELAILVLYSSIFILIIFFTDGILFIPSDSIWLPMWSWELFLIMTSFVIIGFIVPNLIFSYFILRRFKQEWLKKRLIMFIVSNNGLLLLLIGAALYNTWDGIIFANIWALITISVVPFSIMLYYSIGRDLKIY